MSTKDARSITCYIHVPDTCHLEINQLKTRHECHSPDNRDRQRQLPILRKHGKTGGATADD